MKSPKPISIGLLEDRVCWFNVQEVTGSIPVAPTARNPGTACVSAMLAGLPNCRDPAQPHANPTGHFVESLSGGLIHARKQVPAYIERVLIELWPSRCWIT